MARTATPDIASPTPFASPFDPLRDVAALAAEIAERGIAAAGGDRLDAVVRAARRAGVCPTLVTLVADPSSPAVARERAFGMLAAALATASRSPRPLAAA
ncbi:MAG: hypothetical protein ACRDZZ_08910 [Ilumatobacteraceae bacterium]